MPKKLLRRYLPDHHTLKNHKHLQLFGRLLHDPNLWHLNRRSAAGAFSVGLFMAFVPVPFQMLLAAAGAIIVRVNLPISVALVWLTNPITMPPVFYAAYKLGAWLLGIPAHPLDFSMTPEWLAHEAATIWKPFLLGCLVMGTSASLAGYLTIRALWRLHIVRHLNRRRQARGIRQPADSTTAK